MGACMSSKGQIGRDVDNASPTSEPPKNKHPSRLSGSFNDDQVYFKQHVDEFNGRKRLNLTNQHLIDSDIKMLMQMSLIKQVQELNLENNYITSEGYRQLISKQWPKVKVLNLAVNNITDIEKLTQFPKMQIGYFQQNPFDLFAKKYLSELNNKNGVFLCWSQQQ